MKAKVPFFGMLVAGILVLAGCASVQHNTPSGRPEITIATQDIDLVMSMVQSAMIDNRYYQSGGNPYLLQFDRPGDNIVGNAFFGSDYDPVPNTRATYMFSRTLDGVRVVADFAIVTNPGSAFERRTPVNDHPDTVRYQIMLNGVKHQVEKAEAEWAGE